MRICRRGYIAERRIVESCFSGLSIHGLRRLFERDRYAEFSFFTFDNAAQVANVNDRNPARLHRENNLFGFGARFVAGRWKKSRPSIPLSAPLLLPSVVLAPTSPRAQD